MSDVSQTDPVVESVDRLFARVKSDLAEMMLGVSMDESEISDEAFTAMIKAAERTELDVPWVLGTLGLLGSLTSYREAMSATNTWDTRWSSGKLPDQLERREILEKLSFALSGQT